MRKSLAAALGLVALSISACSTLTMSTNGRPEPRFVLEDYFAGRTYAYGVFEGRDRGLKRSFTVVADGAQSGDVFTLHERFLWNDGERQSRIWTFTKVEPGRYEGRAADVIGVAEVTNRGNALRIRYKLRLPVGKSTISVDVDDWSHLLDDSAVINRADVSKFGVHVGRITLTFVKPGAPRPTADKIGTEP